MTSKLVVGPTIDHGLRTNRLAFAIDNDSFPVMINAYQWRGRVKRKRGTGVLSRLRRFFNSLSISYSTIATITLDGSGNGNLITGFGLQSTSALFPGTISIVGVHATYTDPAQDGTLSPSGSINYASGAIVIAAEAGNSVSASFNYYPDLPVMGLEQYNTNSTQFPFQINFDTVYAYNMLTNFPNPSYDVSFYKNPPSGTYPDYIAKSTPTPTTWNGQDYQQFWTTTAQGVLWTTNGIQIPFNPSTVGMQFKLITNVVIVIAGSIGPPVVPAVAILTIVANGLEVGDFLFINEVQGITGINYETGYVIVATTDTVTVEFPNTVLGGAYISGGIAQYLTNRSNPAIDCLRWYDGDPTNQNILNPTLNGSLGWVNFAPPLIQGVNTAFSLDDEIFAIYYLVGARMIIPFKNRLLFLGPVIQTSSTAPIYLPDVVIYSQDGTAFYTASWQGTDPRVPISIRSILTPDNETAFPAAWFEDSIGFGGFQSADLNQPMVTCSSNEDSLIIGFTTYQTRLIFSGNDILPFTFYLINAELGSSSTFSAVNMDRGVITRGSRGYVMTSQTNADRIDPEIPDQVFEINLTNNGTERITAARDYINEWIYFTYPSNTSNPSIYRFPTQTLQFNYRDNSWAIFNESYTCYGQFSRSTGFTWQTVGFIYPSWNDWTDSWNSGASTLLQPEVIAGNQQGFVLTRGEGTGEAPSLFIQGISGSTITSPDHCLNTGDFVLITGCIGTISAQVNGRVFFVQVLTENTFNLSPNIGTGTYIGNGIITRYYVPFIQTKQFPTAWQDARKTRIGVQRYLLSATQNAQIQLLIYLSQNATLPYNIGGIVPNSTLNSSLIYSNTLFTCPESSNLGLTQANVNQMTPTAFDQAQIWHRINTSLIGDTVQLGFTISRAQMEFLTPGLMLPITGASQANPCVLDVINPLEPGQLLLISGVVGMIQLNSVTPWFILETTSTTITIEVDATGFTAYESGGIATLVSPVNQTAEVELHSFILDISPSQMLV